MLFSKKTLFRIFSGRPNRRRGGYAIPAQVQTLQSKALLSAAPIDTGVSYEESYEESEESSFDESYEEAYMESEEDSYTESYEEAYMESEEDSYTESYEEAYMASDDASYTLSYGEEALETGEVEVGESSESSDSSLSAFGSVISGSTVAASSSSTFAFVNVTAAISGNSLSVSGTILSSNGDYSDLTLSFGGVLSGVTATIDSGGNFFNSTSAPISGGLGTIDLLRSGVSAEKYTLFV